MSCLRSQHFRHLLQSQKLYLMASLSSNHSLDLYLPKSLGPCKMLHTISYNLWSVKDHVDKWLSGGWKNWLFIPSLSSSVRYMIILDPVLFDKLVKMSLKNAHLWVIYVAVFIDSLCLFLYFSQKWVARSYLTYISDFVAILALRYCQSFIASACTL